MKTKIASLFCLCACCFLFYQCNTASTNTPSINDSTANAASCVYGGYANQTDWGKHLATTLGCGDCHTPKKMTAQGPADDSSLLFAGHLSQLPAPVISTAELAQGVAATNDLTAWLGAWGTSYAANITPDSTGIGNWKEEQFITCIRQGLYKGLVGTRPIMPPMPIYSYRNLTDDELKALFAFLKTIRPVHNVVAEYQPPAGAMHQ